MHVNIVIAGHGYVTGAGAILFSMNAGGVNGLGETATNVAFGERYVLIDAQVEDAWRKHASWPPAASRPAKLT